MEQRSISTSIILSIVTCGIYAWYWIYKLNEAAVQNNPKEWDKSGGMVILLSIVTCGIFLLYWFYSMGKAYAPLLGEDKSTTFLLFCFIPYAGMYINLASIQGAINAKLGG